MAQTSNNTQNTIFNLIILDESGSMFGIKSETINGCNDTIATIREAAEGMENTRSFVSIYAFNGGGRPSRYIIKNANPTDVRPITSNDYTPGGNTPLLDAIGSTLTELQAIAATHTNATGVITIITDGEENSSRNYNVDDVTRIISALKEQGWTINLIGAEIDLESMGRQLNIDNTLEFAHSGCGSAMMWNTLKSRYTSRYKEIDNENEIAAKTNSAPKRSNKKFF